MIKQFVLYAPNVHVGGGKVLLQSLLLSWPKSKKLLVFLDMRANGDFKLPDNSQVVWVSASLSSRLSAEICLFKNLTNEDVVLCFHGLPPLLPVSGRVWVFQQNRNLLGLNPLSQFPLRIKLRLALERFVSRAFRNRVTNYIVQTPTMKRLLSEWYSGSTERPKVDIQVFPFMDQIVVQANEVTRDKKWDFVYVADGTAHKNHRLLLDAWKLLAEDDLFPSLVLTLGPQDDSLKEHVKYLIQDYALNIINLGQLKHDEVIELYQASNALIFPSTSESFGLPLIEARELGLPILASELDFVWDVCCPVHTFDPESPMSICRAVKRYMGVASPPIKLHSAKEFWNEFVC